MGESKEDLGFYEQKIENVLRDHNIEYTNVDSYDFDSVYSFESVYCFTKDDKKYVIGLDGDKTGEFTHFIIMVNDNVVSSNTEDINYDLLCDLSNSISIRKIREKELKKVVENKSNYYYNGEEYDSHDSNYLIEHISTIDFYDSTNVDYHIDYQNIRTLILTGEGK